MTAATDRRVAVLLSLQRALLGGVSARLRAVTVQFDAVSTEVRAFYDGAVTDEDREAMSCVETEVIADFSESDEVSVECFRLDAPCAVPPPGKLVFQRREQ